MKKILILLMLLPQIVLAQWQATKIGSSTYNSTLRPFNQGVYDPESNKTFMCFMQDNSDPYVVTCDHNTNIWSEPTKVLTQPSASKYNYPTMDILPNHHLVLTCAYPFDSGLGFAISTNPNDATSWNVKTINLPVNHVEYPRIKVDDFGNIYIFYISKTTKPAHKRWYYYVKSTDNGQTFSEPILSIQRELDDPYGMCEVYVGYMTEQPNSSGLDEKWWFAYTSSSGFQYEGVHNGDDNSSTLVNTLGQWGSGGSGFTYRWLYNITKKTNSGISSATSTVITPIDKTMKFDKGDKYGIAYHNIYHSDVFVIYFKPSTGHWYDSANNDLGTDVSRLEMETTTARAYTSPTPPSSKDVGYNPMLTVNQDGNATILQNNKFYGWNGSSFSILTPTLPSGDLRYIWCANNKYYLAVNSVQIYESINLITWNRIGTISLPNLHGYALYCTPIIGGHSDAFFNIHEYDDTYSGFAWAGGINSLKQPSKIVIKTPDPIVDVNELAVINAYLSDDYLGSSTRVESNINIEIKPIGINLNVVDEQYSDNYKTKSFVNPNIDQYITFEASAEGFEPVQITLKFNSGIGTYVTSNENTVLNIYPNPIDNTSVIEYSLSKQSGVILNVYNLSGQLIDMLVNSYQKPDKYKILLNKNYSKGIYLVVLKIDNKTYSSKFTVK